MGPWILLLLGAIVALAWPLAHLLPERTVPRPAIPHRQFAIATLVPAVLTPLIAVPLDPGLLPMLVADYLALHLLIYGVLQLICCCAGSGCPGGIFRPRRGGAAALGSGRVRLRARPLRGEFLAGRRPLVDRRRAGAWRGAVHGRGRLRHPGRARAVGIGSGHGGVPRSLGLAVALDFEGLFFLLMIAPVIVLFYFVFGLMGRWVARRGGALSAGIAQGVILAWAIGVSFPMFAAGGSADDPGYRHRSCQYRPDRSTWSSAPA
jgi:hypothetical protein